MKVIGIAHTSPSVLTHYFDRSVCSVFFVTDYDSVFESFIDKQDYRIKVLFFTDSKLYYSFLERYKDRETDKVLVIYFSYYPDLKIEEIDIIDVVKVSKKDRVKYTKKSSDLQVSVDNVVNELLGLSFI